MTAWAVSLCSHRDLGHLVAADVDVLAREEVHDLGEDVLQERERRLLGAVDIVVHAPVRAHLERPGRARQLRVGGQRRLGVARHLDLGDDGHVALLRVRHDIPDLVLRIEAAVRLPVTHEGIEVLGDLSLRTLRADLGELGVPLDLDAPPLVVREVPVEVADLVAGQQVDVALHEVRAEEVPRHVQVHAPVREAGCVGDVHRGHPHRVAAGPARGKELREGLDAVEEARVVVAGDDDPVAVHGETVALGGAHAAHPEADLARPALAGLHRQGPPRGGAHGPRPEVREATELGVGGIGHHDARGRAESERPFLRGEGAWPGDYRVAGQGIPGGAAREGREEDQDGE